MTKEDFDFTTRRITDDEFEDITWDNPEYRAVTPENITGQSRWITYIEQVFKHVPTQRFMRLTWEVGSTEMQEVDLNCWLSEVTPVTKTVTEYEEVK